MTSFKNHFESVSKERYENDHNVLVSAFEKVKGMRRDDRAINANERLYETLQSEEILQEKNRMRDLEPGEDGIGLRYLCSAGEKLRMSLIEIVKKMPTKRENELDESVKIGISIQLFNKGNKKLVHSYRGACLLLMRTRKLPRVSAKRLA